MVPKTLVDKYTGYLQDMKDSGMLEYYTVDVNHDDNKVMTVFKLVDQEEEEFIVLCPKDLIKE